MSNEAKKPLLSWSDVGCDIKLAGAVGLAAFLYMWLFVR
jgi:hypothetical protein